MKKISSYLKRMAIQINVATVEDRIPIYDQVRLQFPRRYRSAQLICDPAAILDQGSIIQCAYNINPIFAMIIQFQRFKIRVLDIHLLLISSRKNKPVTSGGLY